ncbi:MAG: lysine--tRNA ligase [bacterium]|nr:lysine--tRNA ligase [bacterium]
MFNTEQELVRIKKLEDLRARNINPYPYKFEISHTVADIRKDPAGLIAQGTVVTTAGRLMAIRGHGKSSFGNILDGTGKIQIYFKADTLGEKYELLQLLDIGDFIGVTGQIFETHTKEITIVVSDFSFLAKSLHPLPEKWHGIQDIEMRYRKRHLDLIMNHEVKEVFHTRAKLMYNIREFLNKKGFVEVETPVLQPVYGGGFAEPFKTVYNALGQEVYLRISDELYLKRLVIGGFDKVYEFGKDFRNEGMDRSHNPEFTQLELYQAYADYNDMMNLVEELFKTLSEGKEIEYQGQVINFSLPWKKITFFDAIKEYSGFDLKNSTKEELAKLALEKGITISKDYHRGKLLEAFFDEFVEPKLINPTFIIDYPKDISPLAKEHRADPTLVERFEPFIAGIEIGNAFSELNDPLEQLKRFTAQSGFREKGDFEAQPTDEDFIEAMSYGMPPTGGLGLGIDRITMFFTNSHSIKDVLLFPHMKTDKGDTPQNDLNEKSKE